MSVDLESVERELVQMIQRAASTRTPVARTAAVYHDLYIAGDDAYDLLTDIWKTFGVSPAKKIDFPAYFPNETEALGHHWASKLGFSKRKFRRLTVSDLMAVIERGEWFDPGGSET